MTSELAYVLPDEDYRFHVGVRQGDPAQFFGPTGDHERLLSERRRWLGEATDIYCQVLPEGVPLLEETAQFAREWNTVSAPHAEAMAAASTPLDRARALGRAWEPDYLLLKADAQGQLKLWTGCVCFPSSWSLPEKMGNPIQFIHDVVPGLNQNLGKSISGFLGKMRPGVSWERSNWGLSRSPELNQHPSRGLLRLSPPLTAGEVWLRIEDQALVVLPKSGGILFGIRLRIVSLTEVKQDEAAQRGLLRALRTMSEPVAEYKGLAKSRAELIGLLES